jgi:transposase
MGKPHPFGLRARAVALVGQGNTHTEAARRPCVSIEFVNDMVRLERETGSLSPKPRGNPGRGKLGGVKDWVAGRIAVRADLTIDELTAELAAEHGLKVHRSSVGRLLSRLGLSHGKRPAGAWAEAQGRRRPAPHLDRQTPTLHGQPPAPATWKGRPLSMKPPSRPTWPRPRDGRPRVIGARFPFLPPCSPGLAPVEMAFSKPKTLIGKAAARTYHELWQAVGHVCDLFSEEECYNFFKAAGYRTN